VKLVFDLKLNLLKEFHHSNIKRAMKGEGYVADIFFKIRVPLSQRENKHGKTAQK
jgi:hypothetical protein